MMQIFHAVHGRVAIDLDAFHLPIDRDDAYAILSDAGFAWTPLRIIDDLRDHIGAVQYTTPARMAMAPAQADCSSIIKWAFGRSGICVPRRSIQQRDLVGRRVFDVNFRPYDLVFRTRERNNYFRDNPSDGVGHVGVVTHRRSVVHLSRDGLVEDSLADFMCESGREFRGITRVIERPLSTVVLHIPPHLEIESSDDVMWLILRQLPAICRSRSQHEAG